MRFGSFLLNAVQFILRDQYDVEVILLEHLTQFLFEVVTRSSNIFWKIVSLDVKYLHPKNGHGDIFSIFLSAVNSGKYIDGECTKTCTLGCDIADLLSYFIS